MCSTPTAIFMRRNPHRYLPWRARAVPSPPSRFYPALVGLTRSQDRGAVARLRGCRVPRASSPLRTGGVSSARFFELIREADAGESIADRVCSVWRTQFPSGRCQSVEPEALDAAGLPAICIDARSGYSYVVRDLSGAALSLRNSAGDSTADRDGAHGWSFLSFETGRQQTHIVRTRLEMPGLGSGWPSVHTGWCSETLR